MCFLSEDIIKYICLDAYNNECNHNQHRYLKMDWHIFQQSSEEITDALSDDLQWISEDASHGDCDSLKTKSYDTSHTVCIFNASLNKFWKRIQTLTGGTSEIGLTSWTSKYFVHLEGSLYVYTNLNRNKTKIEHYDLLQYKGIVQLKLSCHYLCKVAKIKIIYKIHHLKDTDFSTQLASVY